VKDATRLLLFIWGKLRGGSAGLFKKLASLGKPQTGRASVLIRVVAQEV